MLTASLTDRRTFLRGLIAAPIVVRAGLLMPVKKITMRFETFIYMSQHDLIVRRMIGQCNLLVDGDPVEYGEYQFRVVTA